MSSAGPYPSFAITVGYDAEVPCVVMTWQGYAPSREFRDANERVLNVLVERGSSKLLGDVREFVLIGQEDQLWLANNWIPRAIAGGLRTAALLTPSFYFNQVAVRAVIQALDPDRLSVRQFEDHDDARTWLTSA